MNYQFTQSDIKKMVESTKKDRAELGTIIYPILEKYELEKKEILEICQIGKFVQKIDSQILILDKPKPPSPDFIIKYHNEEIGLEHTQILTADANRYFQVKALLEYSEQIFASKYPNTNVHATISIKNDQLSYKQNQKAKLAENIADFVQLNLSKIEYELPEYITSIKTTKHSQVSFSYNEQNWQAEYLSKERLALEVQKKEMKIAHYKSSQKTLKQYWLVLLIGSLSSVSYELNEDIDYSMTSKFDRVYLMADFDAKIIRVA